MTNCSTFRTAAHLIALLGACVILLGGCAASARTADDPITLDFAGPAALDVESFAGDVSVTADPTLDHATVQLTREGRQGFDRMGESWDTIEQISLDVDVVTGDIGPTLQIRTATEHPEPHLQRAHLDIRMPEVDGVFIRTSRGRVHLEDVQGTVDIANRFGDVRVLTNHAMTRSVRIDVEQGDIVYHTRGNSEGAVECRADNGRIHHRVSLGRFDIQRPTREYQLFGRLNEGDNPVELTTVDGDIYFGTFEHPTRVSRWRIRY